MYRGLFIGEKYVHYFSFATTLRKTSSVEKLANLPLQLTSVVLTYSNLLFEYFTGLLFYWLSKHWQEHVATLNNVTI